MPLVSSDAIVLQAFSYGETSKILRLLTRTHGVRSAIAKGALRPKSRYGGVLEPFSEGVATLYLKEGRDLQTLGGFDLSRSRQSLGSDLVRFAAASLLAEILIRTGSEDPDPDLFDRAHGGFDRLQAAPRDGVEAVALPEAWGLVAALGFAPALDACHACDRPLDPAEEVAFVHGAGGVRCADCAPAPGSDGGRPLPASARAALGRLIRGEAVTLDRTAAHWQLLGRFIGVHISDGAPLRSLAFLAETLRSP